MGALVADFWSWGDAISDCWKRYHVKSLRKAEKQNFSGVDKNIQQFLDEWDGADEDYD